VTAPSADPPARQERRREEPGQHHAGLLRHRHQPRPGRVHRLGRRRHGEAGRGRAARHLGLPRRGHPRRGPGRGDRGGLQGAAGRAGPARTGRQGGGQRQALGGRPGPPGQRGEGGARERTRDLPGGSQRRDDGHPRHGGPHHHRLDARHPPRAAQGLPRDGGRAPVDAAPHRGRLPLAGLRGFARAAVQGRLPRAGLGGVPGQARHRQVIRPVPQGAAGRPGLPDDREPRPADDPDRVLAGQPPRPASGHLRVPDALRHPARGAEAAGEGGGDRAGLHSLRPGVVRLPHETSGRASPEPVILRALPRLEEV
ncbi:MAG: Proline dehydrogenase, partial [uncultured Nocardioides sp.]